MTRLVEPPLLERSMLKLLAPAALVVGFAAPAAAQNVRTANTGALTFNLGGLFNSTPSAFDGVGIGGRYFLNEGLAIRAAIGITTGTSEFENDAGKVENKSSLYALEGGAEFVLARGKSAYLYTGGILQVASGETDPEGSNNNTTTTGLALAGLIGATYFVADSLSVGAEYRLGIAYDSTEEEGSDETTTNTVIGVGTVGFHLGFWFN